MALSDVIKAARIKKNLKQEDVAEKTKVTVTTYSKWENGKTEPKASQVKLLAEILGITEREICQGKLSVKHELGDFLSKVNNASRHVTEFDKQMILWDLLEDDDEYIERLKDASSIDTTG